MDERVQAVLDIGATERVEVTTIVEVHIGQDRVCIGILGAQAVVQAADALANPVQQARAPGAGL